MNRKAIFLDRDGVLTVEKGYVTKLEDLEVFPYAKKCIKQIHKKGYLAIVITNQSAVGRHLLNKEELIRMNQYLIKELQIDDIYYCPHYNQEIQDNQIFCNCRKPNIGLILKASNKYKIDLQQSYFVGDRASDIQTGINAGLKTVLLESGYGTKQLETPVNPDYVFENLEKFVFSSIVKIL